MYRPTTHNGRGYDAHENVKRTCVPTHIDRFVHPGAAPKSQRQGRVDQQSADVEDVEIDVILSYLMIMTSINVFFQLQAAIQ